MYIWLSLSLKKILATEKIRAGVFLLGVGKISRFSVIKNH